MAQPTADRERVCMAYPGKRGEHYLACFALETGQPIWQAEIGHDIVTAPVLDRGRVYASTYDGKVHAFDLRSGDRLWSRDERATSAPWVVSEHVFVSTRREGPESPEEALRGYERSSGSPSAAYRAKKAFYLRSRRHSTEAALHDALDTAVGFSAAPASAKLDQAEALVGQYRVYGSWRYQGSRPVASEGRIYSIVGDEMECLDLGSSSKLWTRASKAAGTGSRHYNPPALANGKLFLTTREGKIECLARDDGRDLWAFDVGAPMEWSPSVASGRVYAGTVDGQLVSMETGEPGDDGWPMWGGGPGHNGLAP